MEPKIYFYPHPYLRDRHLDTIKHWPRSSVVSPERPKAEKGSQVSKSESVRSRVRRSWKQLLPLVNLKARPSGAPEDAVIYVWGALIAQGKFITDLDNPYSLVGYNPLSMVIWRPVIARILRSSRCLEIRCLSEACRAGVKRLFGEEVARKTRVIYPRIEQKVGHVDQVSPSGPRLLFIGTQFEIKGGPELLRAFQGVRQKVPWAQLDVITHLPDQYRELADQDGLTIHDAVFSRDEIWSRFMRHADVLVHPSYMESFGMVVLEAIAHGLAVVANDVYAHGEMVEPGKNGEILQPPVNYWNEEKLAGPLFRQQHNAAAYIRSIDKTDYTEQLAGAIIKVINNSSDLLAMRNHSCEIFAERFTEERAGQAKGSAGE